MKKWWLVLVVVILGLVRIVNVDQTARFVWDESSDLLRMKELWQRPRLTMVGPISEDGTKVFGSLTYYLSLPFVVVGNFDPISPVWATIFFGLLTVLFLVLAAKNEAKNWQGMLFLAGSSIPLIEVSRTAWNPNFIPFWQALGWWCWSKKFKGSDFLGGLCFGLTIHHHYYAVLAVLGIIIYKKYNLKIILGVITAIIPFVIFDITHPPGLFISRALFFNPMMVEGEKNWIWQMVLGIIIFGLVFLKTKNRIWLVGLIQVLGLLIVKSKVYDHYFLAMIVPIYFGIIFLKNKKLQKILIALVTFISMLNWPGVLTKNNWEGNIFEIKQIVEKIILKAEGRNFNLAVLGSPDPNTKGRRYRDLLALKGIKVADINNFDQELIFFISNKEWKDLINDPSYEINNCRSVEAEKILETKRYKWKLYACDRGKINNEN